MLSAFCQYKFFHSMLYKMRNIWYNFIVNNTK